MLARRGPGPDGLAGPGTEPAVKSYKLDLPCLRCGRDQTLRIFIDDKNAFVDCSWCGFREDLVEG